MGLDDGGDNGFWFNEAPGHLMAPMKELGADFLVHHYNPQTTAAKQTSYIKDVIALFEKNNLRFILNTEIANNIERYTDETGWEWYSGPHGTHRFTFRPDILQMLSKSSKFEGVMYDEAEHVQINRNWILKDGVKIDAPFLGETSGLSFFEADALVGQNARILVDELKSQQVPKVIGEYVFPVLFNNFTKAGMTPSYKLMKESWAPLWAACAMGAALQYDSELWSCLDLWFVDLVPDYPGHTPKTLKNNLLFGYWIGNDRMYVENINYNGSLYTDTVIGSKRSIVLSNHGKVYKWFTHDYLPGNIRNYTFRDIKPSIGIIRFDDTDFGVRKNNPYALGDKPFGSNTLQYSEKTANWMKIWHVVSHGVIPVPDYGISWLTYPPKTPYRSFAPMNGVVVYDHTVKKELLTSLKLAFVTGLQISSETMTHLQELVNETGLTVVVTPDLAPQEILSGYSGSGTYSVAQGQKGGKWIISDDFLSADLKGLVAPYLGKNDEMKYTFGDQEVIMKISSDDELTVTVNKK